MDYQRNGLDMKRKMKRKRRKAISLISSIIVCTTALATLVLCVAMFARYRSLRIENTVVLKELEDMRTAQESYYTEAEAQAMIEQASQNAAKEATEKAQNQILSIIKEKLSAGESALKTIRQFYPDEIVMADAGTYLFLPIDKSLKLSTKSNENYIKDDQDIIHYIEEDEVISKQGIDVSRYQEKINWAKVAEDDIDYAFIRVGVRGYTKGEITEDETFEANIKGALNHKIDVGVYFFSQAISNEEAIEEAEYVLDQIEPYKIKYPVVIDVEAISSSGARTSKLTKEERTEYCITFCERIKEAGYTPMIYGNLKSFMIMLDMTQLEDYPKWFAAYDDQVYFPYEYDIWQYTDSGKVNGIKGTVDRNVSYYKP